jgi:hypothetical protein
MGGAAATSKTTKLRLAITRLSRCYHAAGKESLTDVVKLRRIGAPRRRKVLVSITAQDAPDETGIVNAS